MPTPEVGLPEWRRHARILPALCLRTVGTQCPLTWLICHSHRFFLSRVPSVTSMVDIVGRDEQGHMTTLLRRPLLGRWLSEPEGRPFVLVACLLSIRQKQLKESRVYLAHRSRVTIRHGRKGQQPERKGSCSHCA